MGLERERQGERGDVCRESLKDGSGGKGGMEGGNVGQSRPLWSPLSLILPVSPSFLSFVFICPPYFPLMSLTYIPHPCFISLTCAHVCMFTLTYAEIESRNTNVVRVGVCLALSIDWGGELNPCPTALWGGRGAEVGGHPPPTASPTPLPSPSTTPQTTVLCSPRRTEKKRKEWKKLSSIYVTRWPNWLR